MPITPFLLPLLAPQSTPTFEQIEANKHKAYRELKDYREVMKIEILKPQRQVMVVGQRISGVKQRVTLTVAGVKVMESGHDGETGWAISHSTKEYLTNKGLNDLFFEKYVPPKLSKKNTDDPSEKAPGEGLRVGDFNFTFSNGYNVRFESNPPFKVISVGNATLDGKPAKKVVAKASLEGGKRYVQVVQWFYPDKWILRQFEITGQSKAAGSFKATGKVTESSFAANSTPGMFRMDPGLIRGYRLKKN